MSRMRMYALTGFLVLCLTLPSARANADSGSLVASTIPVAVVGFTHAVVGALTYAVAGYGPNGEVSLVFECSAIAGPDAAATGIHRCDITIDHAGGVVREEAIGAGLTLPGPTASAAGIASISGEFSAVGCIEVFSVFIESKVGSERLSRTECAPLPSPLVI